MGNLAHSETGTEERLFVLDNRLVILKKEVDPDRLQQNGYHQGWVQALN